MSTADLDAALLDMTDTQIMAALARRTAAKQAQKRALTAARVRKLRNADGNANVTPDVTPQNRYSPSGRNADGNANVTPDVTPQAPAAPQVSPSPPSSPTGRENLARGSVDDLRAYAVERGLPGSDGEWLHDKMLTQGWKVDGRPVRDWQALTRVWQKNEYFPSQKPSNTPKNGTHLRTPTGGHGRQTLDRNAGTANAGNTSDYSGVGKIPRRENGLSDPQRPAVESDAAGGGNVPA